MFIIGGVYGLTLLVQTLAILLIFLLIFIWKFIKSVIPFAN